TWNYLWLWEPGYVPLCEAPVNYLLHRQSQSYNLAAGDLLRYFPQGELALRTFVLLEPAARKDGDLGFHQTGKRVPLGPATTDKERKQVVASGLVKAGVYQLTTRENDPADRLPFAVAPDVRESLDLEALGDSEIDRQLGFAPVHVTVREDA